MITDMLTVAWKEYREMLYGPGMRFNLAMVMGCTALIGVALPLQQGAGFVTSPATLLYCMWIPSLMVTALVADSFAGERERHTLETLLAGRLSDRAILFGKLAALALYAVAQTWICLLVGLITVNLSAGHGHLLLFPAWLAVSILVLCPLSSWLCASTGLLISLGSATVQKAQQTLAMISLLPILPFIVLMLVLGEVRFGTLLASMMGHLPSNMPALVAVGLLLLLLCDAVMAWVSLTRFQRARLILD